ncbi:hypothetical protein CR513_01471, partial [Mucuna pruriens]
MILKDDGDIDSESSQEEALTLGREGYSSEDVPYERDLLMRENIFYSKCMVNGKCYSLIIDGGSNVNVPSLRLVEKLCLPTIPYPEPCKLQWLSEKGEMIVDKQVNFELTLDKYKDEIFCDVVPMEATHILLGRP